MPVADPKMQEETMKHVHTPLKLIIAGTAAAAALAIVVPWASAQDATTSTTTSTGDAFTVAPPQTFAPTGEPTSSTPRMVKEAIQRSQARSEKLRTLGRPEQWGSEEPFTFDPTK
jgi:hypothetical protein